MLARIADASGHHLPIRGVLCLLSNALLGTPRRPRSGHAAGVEAGYAPEGGHTHIERHCIGRFSVKISPQRTGVSAKSIASFRCFISGKRPRMISTNFSFLVRGTRSLVAAYRELIAADPFLQRNPDFDGLVTRYIRGDMSDEDETTHFLAELSSERRRVFVQASSQQFRTYALWKTSVFHHAREFLDDIVIPIQSGKSPSRLLSAQDCVRAQSHLDRHAARGPGQRDLPHDGARSDDVAGE